jgi:hypothetical protein
MNEYTAAHAFAAAETGVIAPLDEIEIFTDV